MEMKKIVNMGEEGQISKRACWPLMRERFLALKECGELLSVMSDCASIHITKEGVIYEAQGGGKLFFDFEEMPISRAESMLCGTEREDWGFIESLLPEDGVVLDVGANVGWFSIQLAKKYPAAHIYALEPVTETYYKMQRNLELNGLCSASTRGGLVYTTNTGLFDEDGERTIYVPASSEASSLKPVNDAYYLHQEGESGNGQSEQKCQIRTMDTFCREQGLEKLDFIKCDTEGAEKMVFAGAKHVLKDFKPMVYTEMLRKHAKRFGYHPNEIIEFFKGFGYNCYREEDRKFIPFETMDETTIETNFFFLHAEKHADVISSYLG